MAGGDVRRGLGGCHCLGDHLVMPTQDRRQTCGREPIEHAQNSLRLGTPAGAPELLGQQETDPKRTERVARGRGGRDTGIGVTAERRDVVHREMHEAGRASRVGYECGAAGCFRCPDGVGSRRHRAAEIEPPDGDPGSQALQPDGRPRIETDVRYALECAIEPRRSVRARTGTVRAPARLPPAASSAAVPAAAAADSTRSASSRRPKSVQATPTSIASAIDGSSWEARWQDVPDASSTAFASRGRPRLRSEAASASAASCAAVQSPRRASPVIARRSSRSPGACRPAASSVAPDAAR